MTDAPQPKRRGRPRIDPIIKRANDLARSKRHKKTRRASTKEKTIWLSSRFAKIISALARARGQTYTEVVESLLDREYQYLTARLPKPKKIAVEILVSDEADDSDALEKLMENPEIWFREGDDS